MRRYELINDKELNITLTVIVCHRGQATRASSSLTRFSKAEYL